MRQCEQAGTVQEAYSGDATDRVVDVRDIAREFKYLGDILQLVSHQEKSLTVSPVFQFQVISFLISLAIEELEAVITSAILESLTPMLITVGVQ